jgi:hypothetical protein
MIARMLQSDSDVVLEARSSSCETKKRRAPTRRDDAADPQKSIEIQPLPRWARLSGAALDAAPDAYFVAGAALTGLDHILRPGTDVSSARRDSADVSSAGKNSGVEPVFSGALRQRLALKAAAACARLARLREDEAALRDAEHLSGAGVETSPAGRVHRLWRLFASRAVKFDAATLSLAIEYLEAQDVVDMRELADALRDVMASADNPLAAAASASAAAMHDLAAVPAIDAEILALWLADVVLAQKLGWRAPVPLLATVIAHPVLRRGPNGRRPRPDDRARPMTTGRTRWPAATRLRPVRRSISPLLYRGRRKNFATRRQSCAPRAQSG